MIGVLFATRTEADPFLEEMERLCGAPKDIGGDIRFSRAGEAVIAAVIGMGKQVARQGTEAFLTRHRPRRVINAGIAGALSDGLKLGETYVVASAVDWPTNSTPTAVCDATGFEDRETVRLVTSERPVFDNSIRNALSALGDIVDMEGAVIEAVCHGRNIPFTALKCVSDFASEGDRARLHRNIRAASETLAGHLTRYFTRS